MNGPKRFLASGGLKADLLASARGDRPSHASRRRALVAAGAAAAATSSSSVALGSSVVRWAIWKWVAAGLASTVAVVAARSIVTPAGNETGDEARAAMVAAQAAPAPAIRSGKHAPRSASDPSGAESAADETSTAVVPVVAPVAEAPVSEAKAAKRAWSQASQRSVTKNEALTQPTIAAPAPLPASSSQLATEIAALDQAKRAVKSGDATGALHILESYDATFSHGALAPEASALRIEALARAGRRSEAETELGAFRAQHPESPLLGVLAGILHEGS